MISYFAFFLTGGVRKLYGVLLFLYLSYFVLGYYFTALPSSRHAAMIRVGLVALLAILVLGFPRRGLLLEIRDSLKGVERRVRLLAILVLSCLVYFSLRALIQHDFEEFRRVVVVSVFVLVVGCFSSSIEFRFERLISLLSVFGVFVSFFFLYEYFDFNSIFLYLDPESISDVPGAPFLLHYGNTIIAGLFLCFLLLSVSWSFINTNRALVGVFYLFGFFSLSYSLFHTAARTSWVAAATGILVLFLCFKGKERRKAGILVLSVFIPAIAIIYFKPESLIREGLTHRDSIWIQHIHELDGLFEWMFGKGLSANMYFAEIPGGVAKHAHSIYIESLFVGGLFGLLVILLMLSALFYSLAKVAVIDKGSAFLLSVLSAAAASMFFDFSGLFSKPNLVWLWLWFPLSLALGRLIPLRGKVL